MAQAQANTGSPSPLDQAVDQVAHAIGDIMEFWSFKPSMGRVWSTLYLSQTPLSAEEICGRTGLSSGSVSMTLNELRLWGVVGRDTSSGAGSGRRKKLYRAETDIWAMVTRVFKERELKQVHRTVQALEHATSLIEEARAAGEDSERLAFVSARVARLLELARSGERMLARLADTGELSLGVLRGWMGRKR